MDRARIYQQVATLHASSINQGFLATLGVPFLTLMYRAIDNAPDSILLTEDQDGEVLGFVAGGCGMASIYKSMLRRPFLLGWTLLPALVRPSRLIKIVEILRYKPDRSIAATVPKAELLSIAVDARHRGTGIAEALYQRLGAHVAEQGLAGFRITVGKTLEPAHRFYRRMGASPIGEIRVHEGDASVVYVQWVLP